MKKQILSLVGMLTLVLAASSAFAQSQEVRANIPFDFVVSKTTMPAGTYSIGRIGITSDAIVVRGLNCKAAQLAGTMKQNSAKMNERSKLVFHRYGDRYFLSQVWVEGSDNVRVLPKSNLESEVALDLTSNDVILYASTR
jgi:hypothetical protein